MESRPLFRSFAIAFVLAVLALLQACSAGEAQGGGTQASPPAPEVSVAEVLIRDLRDWEEFSGRLEAVSSVELRPRVGGYIESIHFQEGRRVEAGDLLFQIDPRPFRAEVSRLRAERERSTAQLGLARANHARAQRLFAQNAISREELDNLATGESMAAAELEAVGAQLESAELNLEFTHVKAPISGRVSRAIVTAGNLVDNSTLLTTLVSDDPIYAYFDADEQTYLEYVATRGANDPANAVHVGLINEQGYPHPATLDFVDNQVDPNSGTIRARAVLANPDGRFTPGLFARLKIVGNNSYQAALIDDRAIGTDLDKRYVLVVDEQNVAQYRPVETGALVDGLRIVRDGLAAGDLVIVKGLQRVRPGAPVAPTRVATEANLRALTQIAADSGSRPDGRGAGTR